jgi:hypothetical protein
VVVAAVVVAAYLVHRADLVAVEQLGVVLVLLEQTQHRKVGSHSGILVQLVAMEPAVVQVAQVHRIEVAAE